MEENKNVQKRQNLDISQTDEIIELWKKRATIAELAERYSRSERQIRRIVENVSQYSVDELANVQKGTFSNLSAQTANIDYISSDAKYILFEIDENGNESNIPLVIKDGEALIQTYKDKGITIYQRFVDNLENTFRSQDSLRYKCYNITKPTSRQLKNEPGKGDIELLKCTMIAMFNYLEDTDNLEAYNMLRTYINKLY